MSLASVPGENASCHLQQNLGEPSDEVWQAVHCAEGLRGPLTGQGGIFRV